MFSSNSVDPPGSSPGSPGRLRQDLDLEHIENQQLERQLRDSRKKLNSALEVQSQLEMDVVELAKQVSVLQGQVKDLRKSKHLLESDLSQEQMNYMNEKQQWLDKEAASDDQLARLKEENASLKAQLEQQRHTRQHSRQKSESEHGLTLGGFSFPKFGRSSTDGNEPAAGAAATAAKSPTASTFSRGHNRLLSIGGGGGAAKSDNAKDKKAIERLKNELELVQQQTEMVSREYALRHEQIEAELQQNKALASRLMEENEGFQLLLAEKAILGGFTDQTKSTDSLADELSRASKQGSQDSLSPNEYTEDTNSSASTEEPALQKRVYELEFETKSLKNHNKALTLSLERLVQRLLEFKEFEQVLEAQGMSGNINSKTIGSFQTRVVSAATATTHLPHMRNSNSNHLVGRAPGDRTSVMSDMGFTYGGGGGGGAGGSSSMGLGRRGHTKNKDSISSIFSMPASMSGLGPRSRSIKNPSTWTSMILGPSAAPGAPTASTTGGALESDGGSSGPETPTAAIHVTRPVSPAASVSTGPSATLVSSSSCSVSSGGEEATAIEAIISADLVRRPSTSGQKKLRPLTMSV